MNENYITMYLWKNVATQWRMGFGGVVGLDYSALNIAANILDIELTPEIFSKIQILESLTLEKAYKDNEKNKK